MSDTDVMSIFLFFFCVSIKLSPWTHKIWRWHHLTKCSCLFDVLHDLKSFIFFIKQKKMQSETRTRGRKMHYLDLNPYKGILHCAWLVRKLLFHYDMKFSMWFLYEVLIGMACQNKQHFLRPEFYHVPCSSLHSKYSTQQEKSIFYTKTISKKASCAAL